jgi:hypothetical protein
MEIKGKMFVLYWFEQDYNGGSFDLICASPDKDKIEAKKKELEEKAVDWSIRYKKYKERERKFYKEQVKKVVDWLAENRDAILEVSKRETNWTRKSLRELIRTLPGSGISELSIEQMAYLIPDIKRYKEEPKLIRCKDWHNMDGSSAISRRTGNSRGRTYLTNLINLL